MNLHPITKRILWGFGGFCVFIVLMTWRSQSSSAWIRSALPPCAFGVMFFSFFFSFRKSNQNRETRSMVDAGEKK
jgi:hypothetical protein